MEPLIKIPEHLLIQLLLSHSKLGTAEWDRNPLYDSDHYQHKAATAINEYLKEEYPVTWYKFLDRVGEE